MLGYKLTFQSSLRELFNGLFATTITSATTITAVQSIHLPIVSY